MLYGNNYILLLHTSFKIIKIFCDGLHFMTGQSLWRDQGFFSDMSRGSETKFLWKVHRSFIFCDIKNYK